MPTTTEGTEMQDMDSWLEMAYEDANGADFDTAEEDF